MPQIAAAVSTAVLIGAACALGLLSPGCSRPDASPRASATPISNGSPAASQGPPVTPVPLPSATPPAGEAPTVVAPSGAAAALAAARRDLAQRQKLEESRITLVRIEAVDWPDSSLGCPQPGMMYLQVITPGYRLVLAAPGVSAEYHTDAGGRFVICP